MTELHLRAFIDLALLRCHPNHAILLQARLALVAFGFQNDDEGGEPAVKQVGRAEKSRASLARTARKLAAAVGALALAERLLPRFDVQKADLRFQIGLAHHQLASAELTTAGKEWRLREAAESMMHSARQFHCSAARARLSEQSKPGLVAEQFSQLLIEQIKRLRG